jgi:hypothetical protein
MSFAICRVQHFKRQAVTGIQIHDRRERPSRSNPDIDTARAEENYSLVKCPTTYLTAIGARINELPPRDRAIRSDAVLMSQILVTSDKPFFDSLAPERQREFFQQSLSFIQERYGKENVISAGVHMDEKTPHMYVNVVPVVDRCRGKGPELNRKALFTRDECISLQNDFHAKIGASWGLERGQSREAKVRHLSVTDFKLKTQAEAQEIERQDLLRQKEKQAAEHQAAVAEQSRELMDALEHQKQDFESQKKELAKAQEKNQALLKIYNNTVNAGIDWRELEPLEKGREGLFNQKKIFEMPHEVADRLNNAHVHPQAAANNTLLRQLDELKKKEGRDAHDAQQYRELTKGLYPKEIERLSRAADDIRQEKKLEQAKTQSRGFSR